ncbi:Actin-depolymerizing factor [Sesamum angolense]|uniref:Actin-depolymerizing factor n=1 Tax=Sesamum angolense TaxID=2727404 RepID=A0AAE1X653_9LAMI|nr:Actin-depolymerizing factor [Sesamum angolense]
MSFRGGGTNASSGMGVADHSKTTYMELQRKKVFRYVIFKIDEKKKEVVVERLVARPRTMTISLHLCLRTTADMQFMTLIMHTMFFLIPHLIYINCLPWKSSIGLPPSQGFVQRCFTLHPRKGLGGAARIHYEIQATDPTEMDLDVIRERAN